METPPLNHQPNGKPVPSQTDVFNEYVQAGLALTSMLIFTVYLWFHPNVDAAVAVSPSMLVLGYYFGRHTALP